MIEVHLNLFSSMKECRLGLRVTDNRCNIRSEVIEGKIIILSSESHFLTKKNFETATGLYFFEELRTIVKLSMFEKFDRPQK